MLEAPSISHAVILACLHSEYGLGEPSLTFLPLGADLGTAVYRATAANGRSYFVKLRFGTFDPIAALLPRWLAGQGITEVMAPLPARSGKPYVPTADFTMLLYPYIEGRDAYETVVSDAQWAAFGRAMRAIHDARLPADLERQLPRETYDPRWRDQLRDAVAGIESAAHADRIAQRLSAFLSERQAQVLDLVERTERLAAALKREALPGVVCHTDLHAGNLLLTNDGQLFIVDWDAPLLAPRERDLMYPGGGQGFLGRPADEEELFYSGYGAVRIDARALAYYRLERVIEDLAIFCDQLLRPGDQGGQSAASDREQALKWALSNFRPGGVLEIAYRTALRAEELEDRAPDSN